MASKSLDDLNPDTKRLAENFIKSCEKADIEVLTKTCKSGLHKYIGKSCPECAKLRSQEHYRMNKEKYAKKSKLWAENNKAKLVEYQSAWRKENKEKCREYTNRYRLNNYEKTINATKKWGENNKATKLAAYSAWATKNMSKVLERNRTREAKKKQRTPIWFSEFDSFVFEEALLLAKNREFVTGFKWEVDHIVPLISNEVCGLHIANNFRVIPWRLNRSKGNRRLPEWDARNGF